MLTENQIKILRSENELLHIQLDDVNMMIKAREDELHAGGQALLKYQQQQQVLAEGWRAEVMIRVNRQRHRYGRRQARRR